MALTYKDAGVDIDAGDALVEKIKARVAQTCGPRVVSGVGGFACLYDVDGERLLAAGTDGVGTKLLVAQKLGIHHTIGIDLVAMCINDILCTGAKGLFFMDYLATGKLDVDVSDQIVAGIVEGCMQSKVALIGGETAEMPGFYQGSQYDLAGFCVGIVEKDKIINGAEITKGDKIIGLPSSGPHSNGFSLIRKNLELKEIESSDLIDEMMNPTKIYVRSVLALLQKIKVKGMVHITGGGFYENIRRILPSQHLSANIDLSAWERPQIFKWLQDAGRVDEREMLTTFNCGIGYLIIVSSEDAEKTTEILALEQEEPLLVGEIVSSDSPANSNQILI